MALAWFQLPQAESLITGLEPRQLSIIAGEGGRYEWRVPEAIENEVDRLLDFCTNKEVGYTFEEFSDDRRERWIAAYESQAPLRAFLHARFGDPTVFRELGYPIPVANRMWQQTGKIPDLEGP